MHFYAVMLNKKDLESVNTIEFLMINVLPFHYLTFIIALLLLTSRGCWSINTLDLTSTGGEGRKGHQQTVIGLLKYK